MAAWGTEPSELEARLIPCTPSDPLYYRANGREGGEAENARNQPDPPPNLQSPDSIHMASVIIVLSQASSYSVPGLRTMPLQHSALLQSKCSLRGPRSYPGASGAGSGSLKQINTNIERLRQNEHPRFRNEKC